jgi:hypothetical protein
VPAQQGQLGLYGELHRHHVREGPSSRGQQDEGSRFSERLPGAEDGLGLEHHPPTAAERVVVHLLPLGDEVAQVDQVV